MYHDAVPSLAEILREHIARERVFLPGERVGVAVSGGADSVALLRLLLELRAELGIVLSVVHFNHKLRGAGSDDDERFVAELADAHGLEFYSAQEDVATIAGQSSSGIEAAARELRYGFFRRLILPGTLNKIATAHTLDDQAETVLMRMLRGTGLRGLAGIYPRVDMLTSRNQVCGAIVRPLLYIRRAELLLYLHGLQQTWREDASNQDLRFLRNRVRHSLLPLLEKDFNPAVALRLSEFAEIAREEESQASSDTSQLLREPLFRVCEAGPFTGLYTAIDLKAFLKLSVALQRRVIYVGLERCTVFPSFQTVEEVRRLANANPGEVHLTSGRRVRRTRNELCFEWLASSEGEHDTLTDYQYCLPVPGQVAVPEVGARFEAIDVNPGQGPAGCDAGQVYDPGLVGRALTIRNWRAGDLYWPAHTSEPKKVKELLTRLHISGRERKLWPVIVSGDQVIWLRGFPAPAGFRAAESLDRALLIREEPLRSLGPEDKILS